MTVPGSGREPDVPQESDADGRRPLRRPGPRRDPAAMRETLDAARRRLGVAGPNHATTESAAHQRALLRDAVANQSVPLMAEPGPDPAEVHDGRRASDTDADADADAED